MKASAGIYFVVFEEGKWHVRACRDDSGTLDHSDAWSTQIVPSLSAWPRLSADKREELGQAYSGFPRGRIVRNGRRFVVYHGNDWKKFVAEAEILEPFGLRGKAGVGWTFDDHERCMTSDQATVRQILGVRERWAAS